MNREGVEAGTGCDLSHAAPQAGFNFENDLDCNLCGMEDGQFHVVNCDL